MSDRGALLRSFASALAGFVVYGGWAWWVNSAHGEAMGLRAGLIQGSYSFALTFGSTLLMEGLYARLRTSFAPRALTIGSTGVLLLTVPIVIHMLAGTAEILLTIAPGFAIGMVYTTVYVLALAKLSNAPEATP